jgi:hypothetical protein
MLTCGGTSVGAMPAGTTPDDADLEQLRSCGQHPLYDQV